MDKYEYMEEEVQPYYYIYQNSDSGVLYYFLCGRGVKSKFYYDFFVMTCDYALFEKDMIKILEDHKAGIKHEHKDNDIVFHNFALTTGFNFDFLYGRNVAEFMTQKFIDIAMAVICNAISLDFIKKVDIDFKNKIEEKEEECSGCNCRVCKEFNFYALPDNVVSDSKYTCWNCANSYHRIIRGLDVENIDKQVAMIKKNYGIL